ncbi:hypothetical protein AAHE18_04G238600 [Arachis hypogaea]|nr:uncharacterized protein DS421_14g484510 [Arachis hypogaea]
MASKYALVILGLLAMIVLIPSKTTAARGFPMKGSIGTMELECPTRCCIPIPVARCICCCDKPPEIIETTEKITW